MIPPQPLHLFAPQYAEAIDASTQVTRFPPNDAYCPALDNGVQCAYPYCSCYGKPPDKEDE